MVVVDAVVIAWVVVVCLVVVWVVVSGDGHVYSGHGHPFSHSSWHGHFRVSDKNSLTKFDHYLFYAWYFKTKKSQTANPYYRKQHTPDHQDYTDSCSCGTHWQSTSLVRVIISFFKLWYKFVLRSSQIKKSGLVSGSSQLLQIGFGQSVHPRGHLSRQGHQLWKD